MGHLGDVRSGRLAQRQDAQARYQNQGEGKGQRPAPADAAGSCGAEGSAQKPRARGQAAQGLLRDLRQLLKSDQGNRLRPSIV